jgi:thiamine-monophosphate kinase
LRRDGAQIDDDIWVSGELGCAALGLAHLQGRLALPENGRAACLAALHQPSPRVNLGLALRGIAHSAIDLSDGLLADLGHILELSRAGAEIDFSCLPVAGALTALTLHGTSNSSQPLTANAREALLQRCVLSGGDDYELCFTAPTTQREGIEKLSARLALPLTRIGKIVAAAGCKVRAADGSVMSIEKGGYDHFA